MLPETGVFRGWGLFHLDCVELDEQIVCCEHKFEPLLGSSLFAHVAASAPGEAPQPARDDGLVTRIELGTESRDDVSLLIFEYVMLWYGTASPGDELQPPHLKYLILLTLHHRLYDAPCASKQCLAPPNLLGGVQ